MKAKTQRLRRGIHILPAALTVGNLFFGYYSILSTARGTVVDLDTAAKAIGLAVILDALDGRVARMSNVTSPFGKEFDSLADVVSFGLAPAFLALAWGFRGLNPEGAANPAWVEHVYHAGWIACFFYMICGAWRLARFNIQAGEVANAGVPPHRYFVGLPIPAAAGVIAAMVHAVEQPIQVWYWAAPWVVGMAGLGYLMVSTIRYYSFKHIDLGRRRSSLVVVGIGLLVGLIWKFSRPVLLVIAVSYLLSGLIGLVRRRLAGHPPAGVP